MDPKQRKALTGAVTVLALIVIAAWAMKIRCRRERFVSPEAKQVYDHAKDLFTHTGGRPTYSRFKMEVPGADPVRFKDLQKLWNSGKLTPEAVQSAL